MLEQVQRLLDVGRFKDFVADFSPQFGEVTLIYGDNGVGKTTLAAVLDSLREDSATYVHRRVTLGGGTPEAEVHLDGTAYVFDGDEWGSELPHDRLEVYYSDFVARSVYCGNEVVSDNHRGLCEFALGRKAVGYIHALTDGPAPFSVPRAELGTPVSLAS
jgi:energy-coupling factor transporter ATP-binding protein EcfA2